MQIEKSVILRDDAISSRLHLTAEYFRAAAGIAGVGVALRIVGIVWYAPLREAFFARPLIIAVTIVLGACTAVGWWLTGAELHARSRRGGWLALGALVPPLIQWAIAGGDVSRVSLVLSVLGVIAVLSTWRELE